MNFLPNNEQVKSGVRWVLAALGGTFFGVFISKGWVTAEQVQALMTNETLVGIIASGVMSLGGLVWGLISRKESNMVAAVNAMPDVQGVVTTPTPEGRALAAAVPSPTVVTAGTGAATAVAKAA